MKDNEPLVKIKIFGYEKTEKDLKPSIVNEIRKYIIVIEIIILIIIFKVASWIW